MIANQKFLLLSQIFLSCFLPVSKVSAPRPTIFLKLTGYVFTNFPSAGTEAFVSELLTTSIVSRIFVSILSLFSVFNGFSDVSSDKKKLSTAVLIFSKS